MCEQSKLKPAPLANPAALKEFVLTEGEAVEAVAVRNCSLSCVSSERRRSSRSTVISGKPSNEGKTGSHVVTDTSHGVVGFGHVAGPDLMGVHHLGELVEAHIEACPPGRAGESERVVDEDVPAGGLDVEGRQAGEVGVERRGVGVARFLAGQELLRAPRRARRR